jgi:hypothetical protein
MRRTIAKNLTLLVAIVVGAQGLTGLSEMLGGQFLSGLMTLLVTGVIFAFLQRRYQAFRRYQKETYQWYVQRQQAHSSGRPVCTHCGGSFLQTRRLMRYTYTREHFCGTCGASLYYSEER